MIRAIILVIFWGLALAWPPLTPGAAAGSELVHFKELLFFLDLKMPGWEVVDKPGGETLKQESIRMSQVKASYKGDGEDQTMEIMILDSGGRGMPWLGVVPHMELESSEEYVRNTDIDGFKASETYKHKTKEGALNINVANRFWVRLEGRGLENIDPLKTAAQKMDLKKLADLAK